MSTVTDIVRWVVLGRTDGVRAALRARLGVLSWVDRPYPDLRPASTHAEPASAPHRAGWQRLLPSAELAEGGVTEVVVGEQRFALARVGGQVFAVDGICAHAAGPLGEGHLAGHTLTCPVHGWSYDVRTGASSVGPEVTIRTFPVTEEIGAIWLVSRAD